MSTNQLLNGSSCIPPKSNSHTFAPRKDYKNEKKGKSVGKIVERSWGFSSWIRFGERGLSWLLEWVEDCCEGKFREPFRRLWNKGGKGYKLELRCNKTERGGLSNLGFLKKCLVGRWDGSSDRLPALDVMNFCAHQSWRLKGACLREEVCSLTGGSRRLGASEKTEERCRLKWAKLLNKSSGRKVPTRLLVVERDAVLVVRLWEFPPQLWMSVSKRNYKSQMIGITRRDARAQLGEWRGKKGGVMRVPFVGDTSSSLELFNNFLLKAAEQGSARWVLGVNEALLAKAIGFKGRPTLSTPSSSPVGPPTVIDGSTGKPKAMPPLETLSSGSQDEDLEVNKALEACCLSQGEELSSASLPSKFAKFSSFLGLQVVGFEKEINSLLRKMESRKGHEGEGRGAIGFEFFRYELPILSSVYSCLQHVNLDSFVEYSSMENKEVAAIVTSTSHEKVLQEGTDCPARNFSLSPISHVSNFPMNLLSDLSTKKAIGGGRKANEVYHHIGPPLAPIALHTSISSTQ
ncbi:hypothetical protein CK203_027235 [Vitis vinifera]|uniref:Uncharacterized protein n=1 Tax=Vitis vinifera TaxID=29760 RepID=A0A438J9P1_VITVI|nr:hypothetical protein CK203_027235 [Vitis vinifera]